MHLNRCATGSAPPPPELHFPEGPESWACALESKEAATRSFTPAVSSSESEPQPESYPGRAGGAAGARRCPQPATSPSSASVRGDRQAVCRSPGIGSPGRGVDQAELGPEGGGRGSEGGLGPGGEESQGEVREGLGRLVSRLEVLEVRVGGIGRRWELKTELGAG